MPQVPQDFLDRMSALEERLRFLEGRAQIRPAMNQILGGDVTVGEGGTFKVNNLSGGPEFYVGGIGPAHPDGSPQRGFLAYREDGSLAITIATTTAAPQTVIIRDRAGNWIASEDPAGTLATPYLVIPFAPAQYLQWQPTTNATFEDIHRATIKRQQPYAYVIVCHTSDDPATTGEVRVTVNGTAIGSPTAVAFAQNTTTIGPFALPGAHLAQVDLKVQARRTAGTGNVRCTVAAASGIQS